MFGKIFKKIPTIFLFAKALLLRRRIPLFVGWDLTYRCNLNCKYCKISQIDPLIEISTKEVCKAIEQLWSLGTRRIHFGGGEVLLRDDLGQILTLCKQRGISTVVLTNGVIFEEKIDVIKLADMVKISFDGNENAHDSLRGKGSHKKVLRAVELARINGIKMTLNCSLHTGNVDQVDYILKVSHELKVPVKFQIINSFLSGDKDISAYALSSPQKKMILEYLINKKKKNKNIINSIEALKYMYAYPNVRNINCCAGKIYARINSNGYLYPCQMMHEKTNKSPFTQTSIEEEFKKVVSVNCRNCLCTTTLELNFIYSLELGAILNGLKKF
jgi:MoaA/NifB/PqqE/SkfB family radical SAM enzyme